MPFAGQLKATGRPHLLSLRNVAHSANDGTAVFFVPESMAFDSLQFLQDFLSWRGVLIADPASDLLQGLHVDVAQFSLIIRADIE